MIDEKKIKEAAIECADEYISMDMGLDREETNREIFTRGAEWAQQEFIKSLWHDASEEPRKFSQIVVEIKYGKIIEYMAFKRTDDYAPNWRKFCVGINISRWFYLSDILPKEGGEK